MNTNDRRRLHSPRRASWLAAALGIAVAGAAVAAPQLRTIENCIETGTQAVSLPAVAYGTLSATPCSGCPNLGLRFDERTVYLVGKQPISYAKFREAAAKGDLRLDVFYHPQTKLLTRLRLPAVKTGK